MPVQNHFGDQSMRPTTHKIDKLEVTSDTLSSRGGLTFRSIKTGTTNGLDGCDHFDPLGENSETIRGRQLSELLAVSFGISLSRF
jgi:hypothetical protein